MALAISDTIRNNMLDEITAVIDDGASGGTIELYTATQPAKGGATTTEVATLTFSTTSFPAASSGAMTANAITDDTNATGGTATWFRINSNTPTFVMDGTVGTSGTDLVMDNNVISAGATVSITSFVLTAGNN